MSQDDSARAARRVRRLVVRHSYAVCARRRLYQGSETTCGPHTAITARVSGRAFYSGKAEFMVEDDDSLARGFLVR